VAVSLETVARVVALIAAERGGDRAFVFPGGGSNLELIEELEGCGVEVVLAHSEGGATMMAAAYADLTGRPALVLVGLGPGVANAVNGLAHASLDQSAVVLISDRFTDAERSRSGHQVLDHVALLAPVTRWQATLDPARAVELTELAFAIAATPPRGPVHLELTREVALAPAEKAAGAGISGTSGVSVAPSQPAIDHELLREYAAALADARRPAVLVGDEALAASQESLVALIDQLGAPVLSTYKAKGAVPEEHPLWCGILTNAAIETPLLRMADAILALGVDPVELLSAPWPATAAVIAIREHDEPVSGYAPAYTLCGEVEPLVGGLTAALARQCGHSAVWSIDEVAELRSRLLGAVRIDAPGSLTALDVVELVQAGAPADAIVTVDAGAHMLAATWGWRSNRPRSFLISNGLATMGFAVPAAVAAALAMPDRAVVAFTGDGGLLLHGSELETAVRVRARLLVVVVNDSGLSLIRIKQQERRYRRAAVDFGPIDAAGFGRSLGAAGFTARTAHEVRECVGEAIAHGGPSVLDVRISGSEYRELQRVIRLTGAPQELVRAEVSA
jgi:acetolactate synthase I/II/III large subunit